jgi:catechol 2,3-dioxygenase-like lactoylglutathione lyase family enzyme
MTTAATSAPTTDPVTDPAGLPNPPVWKGVNHLALVTPDMDATVRFYAGVLGMRLCATLMAGPMRHYFFEIGDGQTVAFFEIPGTETFAKPAGGPTDRVIQFDHLAFGLSSEAELIAMQERLTAAGCEVTRVVDHGILHSIYFTDPNGIALEASWWVHEATGRTDYADPDLYSDPTPVPAVAELAAGRLEATPSTHLV